MTPNEDRIQALLDRWELQRDRGESVSSEELCREAPELLEEVERRIAILSAMEGFLDDGTIAAGATQTRDHVVKFRLAGYEILSKLGEGGMGSVYLARQLKLRRKVAIKVLPQNRIQDPAAASRFEREMIAVGALNHEQIVQAHDAGEVDGVHYLVMELVEGQNLSDILKRVGPLKIADACELIRQAAVGLQYVHSRGLVHRDIKPSNLMLAAAQDPQEPPKVKILDLGLALLNSHHAADEQMLTSTGQMMGTIDYMSPEQAMDTHQVDIRADIYSLGATLYKLLTGRAPFEDPQNNSMLKRLRALDEVVPAPLTDIRPDCPKALSDLVVRLLAKSPDERPVQPGEVAQALVPFAKEANLGQLLQTATHAASSGAAGPLSGTFLQTPTQTIATTSRKSPAHAPASLGATKSSRFRRRIAMTVCGIGASVLLYAVIMFVIGDGKGTLIVEAPEDLMESISASIVRDGHAEDQDFVIKPGATQHKIRSGRIEIKLPANIEDEFKMDTPDELIVRSGKLVRLKLTRKPGASPIANSTPSGVPSKPVAIVEPPPLEEWLKGRTILTVAQDGSGQFKTIQEALNALQSGQVVKVLDKGPYRERLESLNLPRDTGLISERQTIVEIPEWAPSFLNKDTGIQYYIGHNLYHAQEFRLHGVDLRFPKSDGKKVERLAINGTRSVVLENCLVRAVEDSTDIDGNSVVIHDEIWRPTGPTGLGMSVVVRECAFAGSLAVHAKHQQQPPDPDRFSTVLVERCVFLGNPAQIDHLLLIHGSLANLAVRNNVFEGLAGQDIHFGCSASPQAVELSNNTLSGLNGILVHNDTPGNLLAEKITIRNNAKPNNRRCFLAVAPENPQDIRNWIWDHNAYQDNVPALAVEPNIPPRQPGDLPRAPGFLSLTPTDRNYLRLDANDPLAKAGAGGAWPEFLGALPPGPAPTEGDWFTRLQARWINRQGAEGLSAPNPATPKQLAFQKPGFEKWIDEIRQLNPRKQVDQITKKLVELNPGFDGKVESTVEEGKIQHLQFDTDFITDISPLRAVPELKTLIASDSKHRGQIPHWRPTGALSDLSPLKGMQLEVLELTGNPQIEDFSPLAGMPLKTLLCYRTGVSDLSPLQGMKLEALELGFTRIQDISVLKGMPIGHLALHSTDVSDFSPLAGMPLKFLDCVDTNLKDLSVLQGMPLEWLACSGSHITDLAPLAQLPLKTLAFEKTSISDLSPLHGAPLKVLRFTGTSVSDVTPLRGVELETLMFNPKKVVKGIDVLRAMTSLKKIGVGWTEEWPAAEFWKKYDAGEFGKPAEPSMEPLGTVNALKIAPPFPITEPPPLEEWLKGREIVTVAQDGSGQFKTIQSASDALKPGQVIEVLDRGPYRESLGMYVPENCGLISRHNTVIELHGQRPGIPKDDPHHGHTMHFTGRFRLHGFQFVANLDEKTHAGMDHALLMGLSENTVIENCWFQGGLPTVAGVVVSWLDQAVRDSECLVRDCLFDTDLIMHINPATARPRSIAIRNWFRFGQSFQSVQFAGSGGIGIARLNVFSGRQNHRVFLYQTDGKEAIEISNNTILDGSVVPGDSNPAGVTVRNNYLGSPIAFPTEPKVDLAKIFDNWLASNNRYAKVPKRGNELPSRKTDLIGEVNFLSQDEADRNFLRIPADAPDASAGAGGAWPQFIGALTPGPAPEEGDWFTRLQNRWQTSGDLHQVQSAGPSMKADSPLKDVPPIVITEPPPLNEWLEGRTILTVAQDGSGQFKTIQAALKAVQSGEVVKILDKGPYREFVQTELPENIGLISEVGSIWEPPEWRMIWEEKESNRKFYGGQRLVMKPGIRLSGLTLRFADMSKIVKDWEESLP